MTHSVGKIPSVCSSIRRGLGKRLPGGMTGMLRRLWGLNRFLWGNRPEAADEGPNDWRG